MGGGWDGNTQQGPIKATLELNSQLLSGIAKAMNASYAVNTETTPTETEPLSYNGGVSGIINKAEIVMPEKIIPASKKPRKVLKVLAFPSVRLLLNFEDNTRETIERAINEILSI